MTVTEATQLDAAIERADRNGIQVIAQGRMKANNVRFYLTNSHSDPDGVHVVRLVGSRLVCDCKSTVICAHRGASHVHIVNTAARKQRDAEDVERALEQEARTRDRAVLQRSNAPISIFK